jgi:hypothetical protein
VTGLEVVVGFLVAWVVRKANRVGQRADEIADEALDAGLDRVHALVSAKLGTDPALERLELEAGDTGEVGTRTQARVRMALEEAVEEDATFAAELDQAVRAVPSQAQAGAQGVAITGGVNATRGGIAIGGVTGGSVSFQDPTGPARQ